MLVLTRKKKETIVIGESITIKVLEVRGNSVKLGISAPPHVSVHRGEIYQQIQEFQVEQECEPLESQDADLSASELEPDTCCCCLP